MSLAHTSATDLPPRTWRQWWRELPGYWRIGVWAVGLPLIVNTALVIRFVIGWQDAQEIKDLRKQVYSINFHWERSIWEPGAKSPFRGYEIVMRGMMGRSCRNVACVVINESGNQDQRLQEVCGLFPNLEAIAVWEADISSDGIAAMQRSPQLKMANFRGCDLDDETLAQLLVNKNWTWLDLSGTLITDASLPLLQRLESLEHLNLKDTAVSLPTIENWRAMRTDGKLTLVTNQETEQFLLQVVWPDGRRDSLIWRPFTLIAEGPLADGETAATSAVVKRRTIASTEFLESNLQSAGDGRYRILLSIGNHAADPVMVQVTNGAVTPQHLKFYMPATKAETFAPLAK